MKLTRSLFLAGFTLVEILIGIAVVGALTSAGYVSVANIRESAREKKLEADVSSLNKATVAYLASGGVIPSDAGAAAVIAKLKTRATSELAATTVGMTGSFIDSRVEPVPMSEAEGQGTRLRAVWNAEAQRFIITTRGDGGIGSFTLNEDLAGAEPEREARTVNLAAADLTSGQPAWVWDHAPHVATASSSASPPGSGTPAAGPSATPTAANTLSAPTFNVSGGSFTLSQLAGLPGVTAAGAFTLSISNPNSSTISYLDSGASAVVSPGASGATLSSRAVSIDPDAWADSSPTIQTYAITPFDPTVVITNSGALTPFNLGVARASGSGSSATVTATLSNWGTIPAVFRTDANLELVMAVGSNDPGNASGSAQESVGATLTTSSGWSFSGQNPSLVVSAKVNGKNAALFNTSSVSTQTLSATKGTLTVNFQPVSGTILNASEKVTLVPADIGNFPAGYTIKYTINGSTPSAANGSVYSAPLTPPASGTLQLKAIALAPGAYTNWFDSPVSSATYTLKPQFDITTVAGVLIAGGNIANNATIQGSVVLALQRDGSVPSLILNNNATVVGSIYAPGLPSVVVGNNGSVEGIVDLDGPATPNNYTITVENGAEVGTIYRRITPVPQMPPKVVAPTGLVNRGSVSVRNSPQTLAPGRYTSVSTDNGSTFTLGTAGSSTTQIYHIDNLNLGNNITINVVGPIVLYINAPTEIKNGVVFGNVDHPEWLTIKVIEASSGSDVFEVGNNGTLYAQVIAPDTSVVFSNNSTFHGGVTGEYLDLVNNGEGVVFTLPPATN